MISNQVLYKWATEWSYGIVVVGDRQFLSDSDSSFREIFDVEELGEDIPELFLGYTIYTETKGESYPEVWAIGADEKASLFADPSATGAQGSPKHWKKLAADFVRMAQNDEVYAAQEDADEGENEAHASKADKILGALNG